jgi:hypothetical protein
MRCPDPEERPTLTVPVEESAPPDRFSGILTSVEESWKGSIKSAAKDVRFLLEENAELRYQLKQTDLAFRAVANVLRGEVS